MLEFGLVAYAVLTLFALWMAREENRRKGQRTSFLSVALGFGWPLLLSGIVLHAVGVKLFKQLGHNHVRRTALKTQQSH